MREKTRNHSMTLDLHCEARLVSETGSMPRFPLVSLMLLAVLAPACGGSSPNPFTDQSPTAAPPADAEIAFTSNGWAPDASGGRELFAMKADGSGITRLTFCNAGPKPCDTIAATFAPDRNRVAVLRRFSLEEPAALLFVDLTRAASAELVPADQRVSGVDWHPGADLLVYSGTGQGNLDDLYRTDVKRPTPDNQQQTVNLVCVPTPVGTTSCDVTVAERHPRIDPPGERAVYERIPSSGKAEIFIFATSASQLRVAEAGPGSELLPNSPYAVGASADPAYSPDGRSVVFRRLTGRGEGDRGNWDILTIGLDGSGLRTVASGPAFRGAPDWGSGGIAFPEIDATSGQPSLVIIQPDGTGRRAILTLGPNYVISNPRWLK